jgi:hypothetical protein
LRSSQWGLQQGHHDVVQWLLQSLANLDVEIAWAKMLKVAMDRPLEQVDQSLHILTHDQLLEVRRVQVRLAKRLASEKSSLGIKAICKAHFLGNELHRLTCIDTEDRVMGTYYTEDKVFLFSVTSFVLSSVKR